MALLLKASFQENCFYEFFTVYYGLQPLKKRKIKEIAVKKPRLIRAQKNGEQEEKNGTK